MKSLFLCLIALLVVGTCHAQGNLQFNRVITMADSPLVSTPDIGVWHITTLGTVPTGKVWKIENCYLNSYGSGAAIPATFALNNIPVGYFTGTTSPIWLKGGDVLQYAIKGNGSATSGQLSYLLSIIEFNIVL